MKRFLTLALMLLSGVHLVAQAGRIDSLRQAHDTMQVAYFVYSLDSLHVSDTHYVKSTQLKGFQRYNPLEREDRFYASLGNTGLAHRDLFFDHRSFNDFSFGIRSFQEYLYKSSNIPYYLHAGPVTYLRYSAGPQKEQLFHAAHSRPIGRNLILGADVNVINSPGSYHRQKSDDRSVFLSGRYESGNNRYSGLISYSHNKLTWQENGGIENDTVFEENQITNRRAINVNLQNAQNIIKHADVYVNQEYFLSKPDSLDSLPGKTFHAGRIAHHFKFRKEIQIFTDNNPGNSFYHPFDSIIDSTATYDSVLVRKFENKLSWSNLKAGEHASGKTIVISFGARHQYAEVSGYAEKESYHMIIPEGFLILHPHRTSELRVDARFTFGDFNKGSYFLSGKYTQALRGKRIDLGSFEGSFELSRHRPAYFFTRYHSNHLRWENQLADEKYVKLGFTYHYKRLHAGIRYHFADQFTFLNKDAHPSQAPPINILQLFLNKEIRIGTFHMDNQLIYQKVSHTDVLRLPEFMARISLFFTLPVFNNASVLQPGIDLYYNTAYYADAYMPAVRSFYLQDEKKIGDYLYADVYATLLLKRFRLFAKYQHLNSFFGNFTYYMVPHYPSQDGAFKFGVSWTFYD